MPENMANRSALPTAPHANRHMTIKGTKAYINYITTDRTKASYSKTSRGILIQIIHLPTMNMPETSRPRSLFSLSIDKILSIASRNIHIHNKIKHRLVVNCLQEMSEH